MPQAARQLFHRAVEAALGVSLNAQSQAPDIPGVPSRAVSSRYGSLQDPSFYTPGVFDLQPHAASNRIARAEEAVLGVSFNAQSQAPDIPDVSLHAATSRYATSFQAQSLASNIQVVSLRAYMEELSASFNAQDQAPDDFYAQDRCRAPSIFDEHSRKGSQLLARLLTKQDISHFFLQLLSQDSAQERFERSISPNHGGSRIEFQSCRLWIRFASQGVVCFHSVDFGGHHQDSQYAPCIFVDNPRKGCQVLARLHTTQVISHFFLQLVSQDSTQELLKHTISPYLGVSRMEFQFCCL
jgi:hypothetical protein